MIYIYGFGLDSVMFIKIMIIVVFDMIGFEFVFLMIVVGNSVIFRIMDYERGGGVKSVWFIGMMLFYCWWVIFVYFR